MSPRHHYALTSNKPRRSNIQATDPVVPSAPPFLLWYLNCFGIVLSHKGHVEGKCTHCYTNNQTITTTTKKAPRTYPPEDVPDAGRGALAVVRQRLHDDGGAPRADALVLFCGGGKGLETVDKCV